MQQTAPTPHPRRRSIDGVRSAALRSRPHTPHPRMATQQSRPLETAQNAPSGSVSKPRATADAAGAPQTHSPPMRPATYMPAPETRTRWQKVQTPLVLFGGMVAGFGMQTLAFGLIAVGIYAICSIVFRIYSRTTFILALISLIAVPVILVARQNPDVASNFATYTFILIVIGIVSLIRESPGSGKRYVHAKKRL